MPNAKDTVFQVEAAIKADSLRRHASDLRDIADELHLDVDRTSQRIAYLIEHDTAAAVEEARADLRLAARHEIAARAGAGMCEAAASLIELAEATRILSDAVSKMWALIPQHPEAAMRRGKVE